MNDFERRIRNLAPVKREHVVMLMRSQRQHIAKKARDEKLNAKGQGLLKMASYALLMDGLDVEEHGTTPLRELFDE